MLPCYGVLSLPSLGPSAAVHFCSPTSSWLQRSLSERCVLLPSHFMVHIEAVWNEFQLPAPHWESCCLNPSSFPQQRRLCINVFHLLDGILLHLSWLLQLELNVFMSFFSSFLPQNSKNLIINLCHFHLLTKLCFVFPKLWLFQLTLLVIQVRFLSSSHSVMFPESGALPEGVCAACVDFPVSSSDVGGMIVSVYVAYFQNWYMIIGLTAYSVSLHLQIKVNGYWWIFSQNNSCFSTLAKIWNRLCCQPSR